MIQQKRKLAIIQLLVHILNYLIITYLFLKSYINGTIEVSDICISLSGLIISLILFIYIETKINESL